MLHIAIQNPLPEDHAGVAYRRGNRIALENVRERLMRHFGGRATLQNAEQPGTYYVQITIPIIRG
jgi:sensor histidine kinase YesM